MGKDECLDLNSSFSQVASTSGKFSPFDKMIALGTTPWIFFLTMFIQPNVQKHGLYAVCKIIM
jgi:hypothetical protein